MSAPPDDPTPVRHDPDLPHGGQGAIFVAVPAPMTTKPFIYTETPPPPALADHVLAFWSFEVRLAPAEGFVHHVWPDGCISLIVSGRRGTADFARVAGPRVEAHRVPLYGGAVIQGARFWPDAGGAVLGVDPLALRDGSLAAEEVIGAEARALAAEVAASVDAPAAADIFARWLSRRGAAAVPLDPLVRQAVRAAVASEGRDSVARLAERSGLGVRALQRRFRRAVGLTPKEYLRVRRLRSTIGAALEGDGSWSERAARFGFADQAHLAREFAGATGLTPQRVAERLDGIEHRSVTP